MHTKYQCSTIYTSEDMSQVKVFVTDGQRDRQRDGQTDECDLMSPAFAKARGTKTLSGEVGHVITYNPLCWMAVFIQTNRPTPVRIHCQLFGGV